MDPKWIGAIRLVVDTRDKKNDGTDDWVQALVLRDGAELSTFTLDYPYENDFEAGSSRNYDFVGPKWFPRKNDKTPPLLDGVGQIPMPYPQYGFEFSDGLEGHLRIRLRILGADMWVKDRVVLYVKFITLTATSFDTWEWFDDKQWTRVATWTQDVAMSLDPDEGRFTWTMAV